MVREKAPSLNSGDAVRSYLDWMSHEPVENFVAIGLNTQLEVVYQELVHRGDVDSCIVNPAQVLRRPSRKGSLA